jgi:hypothetical protein
MKMKKVSVLLCFVGWCLWSCDPIQSYSEIPEIHFESLSFKNIATNGEIDERAVLIFSFIDGDGDIGVSPSDIDAISKIHYIWHKKISYNTYEPFQFATGTIADSTVIPFNSVMNKEEAQNKTLKGTIQIALFPPSKPQGVDTMRIEFYIFDRARHKSNVDYTPDFSIQNPPEELLSK